MPAVSTLDELREAVADFAVTGLDTPYESTALPAARTSLDEACLLLLGEVHGMAEKPLLIRDLMRVLQINSPCSAGPLARLPRLVVKPGLVDIGEALDLG
jgi:hypothetical protein